MAGRTSNFNSKFLTILLNSSGIGLPSQAYARYVNLFKYYLLYAFILLTSAQVALLFRVESVAEITITLVFINSGLFLNSTTLILHLKKNYMFNIFESINEDFVRLTAAFGTQSYSDERFKKFFLSVGLPGLILYVFSVSGTVWLFPFSNKKYSDIDALLIPCYFPWHIDTMPKYLFTIGLQFSWLFFLSVPVALNFLFGIYYMIEIRAQYDILCKFMEHVTSSQEWQSLSDRFDADVECKVMRTFNRCIRHHQNILKFTRNFNACYNVIFATNLFYSVPNIALVLLSVAEETSISTIIRNVMALAIAIVYLRQFTYIGQSVQKANDRLRLALFSLPWHTNKSIKFRKTLLLILCSTQRISSLQASNKYVASNELFFDILKMSYSYYNIMHQAFGH